MLAPDEETVKKSSKAMHLKIWVIIYNEAPKVYFPKGRDPAVERVSKRNTLSKRVEWYAGFGVWGQVINMPAVGRDKFGNPSQCLLALKNTLFP